MTLLLRLLGRIDARILDRLPRRWRRAYEQGQALQRAARIRGHHDRLAGWKGNPYPWGSRLWNAYEQGHDARQEVR